MNEELLSARAFATLVDKSNVYISRLVKAGKIPTIDGKIPRETGLKAYHSSKRAGYENISARFEKEKATAAESKPVLTGMDGIKANEQYNKARAIEKTLMVKLKEIELKEAQGLLVPIEQVKADAEEIAIMVRQKILSVAPIIATQAEGKTASQIERIVEIELNEAMKELQNHGDL